MRLKFTFLDYSSQEISGISKIYKDGNFNEDVKGKLEKLYSGQLLVIRANGEQVQINGDFVKSISF